MNSFRDTVVEREGGGVDTVVSSASDFTLLATEAENLILVGSGRDGSGNEKDNLIVGNDRQNFLIGWEGRDTLEIGGDGARDTLFYETAANSRGVKRDLVQGFDARNEDTLAFLLSGPIASDFNGLALTTRTGGSLSEETFKQDVAAALDDRLTPGGRSQAVLWDPRGGDLDEPDHLFLVFDLNNDGDYDGASDIVIELADLRGTLTESDFAFSAIL